VKSEVKKEVKDPHSEEIRRSNTKKQDSYNFSSDNVSWSERCPDLDTILFCLADILGTDDALKITCADTTIHSLNVQAGLDSRSTGDGADNLCGLE
jgi:hypothetical protein